MLYNTVYIMYTVYMEQYSVREFRSSIRKALNSAAAGIDVTITRYGETYWVLSDKYMKELLKQESSTQAANTVDEIVDKIEVPENRAVNGLCKVHGLPLDARGRCLQKGCKYA